MGRDDHSRTALSTPHIQDKRKTTGLIYDNDPINTPHTS